MEAKTETKVERIILRHLTGSKANQEEPYDLSQFPEITIGRHPSCVIRFDENLDDMVSGKHAKITYDTANPTAFTLTDPGSRNGTFVNNHRVTNPVTLVPGDVLQFGAGGPQLEFDCDPHPDGMIKRTRTATSGSLSLSGSHAISPTRSGNVSAPLSDSFTSSGSLASSSNGSESAAKAGIGRETLERVVTAKQSETRRQMLYAVAVLAVVVAGLAWKFRPETAKKCGEGGPCIAVDIAQNYGKATVKIDVTWKLISPSGGLVYHQYMPNKKQPGDQASEELIPGGPKFIAKYVRVDRDTIEPWLSYDGNRFSVPVGGSHSGTGFFVSSSGFVLTNRHVAAAWENDYTFPDSANIGILYSADGRNVLGVIRQAPGDWVPAKTRQDFGGFKGANDKLEVTLNGSTSPVRAILDRVSDRHDMAMIKIDMPEATPMVELNDNYDTIKEGEVITILGYPAVTAPLFGFIRNAGDLTREAQTRVIPKITVTPGNIGAILRGSEGKDPTYSRRDVYQLTANATGAGNSGGPVFDTDGKVIGIFYAGSYRGGATVTYAVPIRYGKELMSLK
jgi:serine protease Do